MRRDTVNRPGSLPGALPGAKLTPPSAPIRPMVAHLLSPKFLLIAAFVASVAYVHFRGRVRLPFHRQLVNHSSLLAPVNSLLYLFSAVPARPYLDRRDFPELDLLRENWQLIREEALGLSGQGHIRAALRNNDAGFNSFFKTRWKRFYLTWYGEPLPSAQALCPRTVELLRQVPSVKAAMFALLPPGAHLNPHRDPFAGSLRYHLGLSTPNHEDCRICVDGEFHSWRDGEDVLFDETFVHWAENRTDTPRIILFCDVERPLRPRWLGAFNRAVSRLLGRATATQNLDTDPVGPLSRLYGGVHWFKDLARRLKRANRPLYKTLKIALILGVLYLILVAI